MIEARLPAAATAAASAHGIGPGIGPGIESEIAPGACGQPGAEALVVLDDVTAGYDRHPAVHHLSLAVAPGEMIAVVGPNGAGKSTLLKLLVGELQPMAGRLVLPSPGRCRTAYLPQGSRTDRTFPITVEDLVASGLWHETGLFGGLDRSQRDRVAAALDAVGLAACAGRVIGSLSGGEYQRVRFAQLMLQDARLVLLDEPFAGVDAATIDVLLPLLARWRTEGVTIVAVLHELDLVRRWFARTLLIARRGIADGPTAAVLTEANWQRASGLSAAIWQSSTWCES